MTDEPKKKRHPLHVYLTAEQRERVDRYIEGDISPYVRHAVQERMSLVDWAGLAISSTLGVKLYRASLPTVVRALGPHVRGSVTAWSTEDAIGSLQNVETPPVGPKTWQKVIKAVRKHPMQFYMLADEFHNAGQSSILIT